MSYFILKRTKMSPEQTIEWLKDLYYRNRDIAELTDQQRDAQFELAINQVSEFFKTYEAMRR